MENRGRDSTSKDVCPLPKLFLKILVHFLDFFSLKKGGSDHRFPFYTARLDRFYISHPKVD